MLRLLFACLICMAPAASAQEIPDDYDVTVLDVCLQGLRRHEKAACIGAGAEYCLQGEAGGSTLGVALCYSAEWQQWDRRLNSAYQALLITQGELAEDNAAFNKNIPNAVDLMREMQRAWITYRDAACDWEHVQWGGGTGAGPASAECMMRLTALQAILLEARL